MLPWLFLSGSLVGAWHTRNALRPVQRGRIGPLWAPALFTAELAPLHLAWQAGVSGLFAWAGALATPPGQVAMATTLASWTGLAVVHRRARRAAPALEEALEEGLGTRLPAPLPRSGGWWPFARLPGSVEVVEGLRYGPHPRHRLDVYRRRDLAGPAPVLVQVHGGSWMRGSRGRQARPLMYRLAARGWVVVAPSYRVSPEATFPDHLVDVKRAIAWVRLMAVGLGVDPGFVAITGGSAGGHLAAMVALTAGDPAYQPGFESADTSVQACVPLYAVLSLLRSDGRTPIWPFLARYVMKSEPADDPVRWRASSPHYRAHASAPPFFVLHGTHDSAVRSHVSTRFVKRLRSAGAGPVVFGEVPGATHGFDYFASTRGKAAAAAIEHFLEHVRRRRAAAAPMPEARADLAQG